MRGVKFSMVGLLLLGAPAAPAAQRTVAAVTRDAAPVFSSGVDMVTVNVSVRDQRGRIVRGLACRDFRLVDSGFGRPIRGVFESAAALRIAVLLDVSGSMALDGSIAHARRIVRSIAGALQPGRDEAALFAFDSGLREIVPFTTALERFDRVDLSGRPYGRTSLYDAVADTASLVGGSGDPLGGEEARLRQDDFENPAPADVRRAEPDAERGDQQGGGGCPREDGALFHGWSAFAKSSIPRTM